MKAFLTRLPVLLAGVALASAAIAGLATAPYVADVLSYAVVLALFFGSTILMASIVFSFQRYFEHQVEEGRKISQ